MLEAYLTNEVAREGSRQHLVNHIAAQIGQLAAETVREAFGADAARKSRQS
jgi:hypothetical protein